MPDAGGYYRGKRYKKRWRYPGVEIPYRLRDKYSTNPNDWKK